MKWLNEKKFLKDLVEYEKNPRTLSKKQKEDIKKSLLKFDVVEIPVINLDNKIIAGHQRIKILYELYGGDYEIDVRVPDTLLDEKDFNEYLLRSNRNHGDWDWNMLDNLFDNETLLDSGFEPFEIDIDKANLEQMFKDMDEIKKKIKVDKCSFCGRPINLDVRFIIKNKNKDISFKEETELSKIIYDKVKDFISEDKKIHIIIE